MGKTLAGAEVRRRYGITVVCIKPAGGSFTYATPDTVVQEDDVLVVAGETARAEAFRRAGVGGRCSSATLAASVLPLLRVGDDPEVDPGSARTSLMTSEPCMTSSRRRTSGVPMKT